VKGISSVEDLIDRVYGLHSKDATKALANWPCYLCFRLEPYCPAGFFGNADALALLCPCYDRDGKKFHQ
jgi:hypothetical protein